MSDSSQKKIDKGLFWHSPVCERFPPVAWVSICLAARRHARGPSSPPTPLRFLSFHRLQYSFGGPRERRGSWPRQLPRPPHPRPHYPSSLEAASLSLWVAMGKAGLATGGERTWTREHSPTRCGDVGVIRIRRAGDISGTGMMMALLECVPTTIGACRLSGNRLDRRSHCPACLELPGGICYFPAFLLE